MSSVLDAKLFIVYGPLGLWSLIATWGCVLLWQAYDRVQEQRLKDAQDMRKEYYQLVEHINQTLNLLVQANRKS